MDSKDNRENKSTSKKKELFKPSIERDPQYKAKSNEQLNEENPNRKKRRQATEAELSNPLHGVKLAEVLERLVDYYGWEYLADRVNIRCFKYDPTMKSSLGFLRKMTWAREHVEDIYVEMVEKRLN